MGQVFSMNVDEEGIGVVTFSVAGGRVNTWTEEAFRGFDRLVEELEVAKGVRGVLFISGKREDFFAGADLRMMARLQSPEAVRKTLDLFHGAFQRLGALGYPVVAAIHGHCLGAGLEFALACTGRIAREGQSTLLGLPECGVGLMPGGGGTQRLPRLIGEQAVAMILAGTLLTAAQALEVGLIDRLAPPEADLAEAARRFLQELIAGEGDLHRPVRDLSGISGAIAAAREALSRQCRGRLLPAPKMALQAMEEGAKVSLEEGLEIEKRCFVEVALSKEAKGSIHSFFLRSLRETPEGVAGEGFVPRPWGRIALLGFGTMGRGIAVEILRRTGLDVLAKDEPGALTAGRAFVAEVLEGMARKGQLAERPEAALARLTTVSEYTGDFAAVDLAIEAVFEALEVKRQLLGELEAVLAPEALVATNTSSLPIAHLEGALRRPDRFGGLHFFSPAWKMTLVEVVRGGRTAADTAAQLLHFATLIGKRPILCRDNPGFVVNALLFPYLLQALRDIEEHNPIGRVDGAMIRFGMPVGPIRLIDEMGIDISYKAFFGMGILQETLRHVVEAGRLGLKKSGRGFFLDDGSIDPEVLPLIVRRPPQERDEAQIQEGCLTAMVRAGRDLLERRIVDDPRTIDAGMIWGVGFPADKGGPMKWADLTGLSRRLFGRDFYPA